MDTLRNGQKLPENEFDLRPEDWQAKVDRLQGIVCILLEKNQKMRMALPREDGNTVCS